MAGRKKSVKRIKTGGRRKEPEGGGVGKYSKVEMKIMPPGGGVETLVGYRTKVDSREYNLRETRRVLNEEWVFHGVANNQQSAQYALGLIHGDGYFARAFEFKHNDKTMWAVYKEPDRPVGQRKIVLIQGNGSAEGGFFNPAPFSGQPALVPHVEKKKPWYKQGVKLDPYAVPLYSRHGTWGAKKSAIEQAERIAQVDSAKAVVVVQLPDTYWTVYEQIPVPTKGISLIPLEGLKEM